MPAPRRFAAAALASTFALPLAASVAEVKPFTPAAFAAEAAGRPILVDVSAPSSLSE